MKQAGESADLDQQGFSMNFTIFDSRGRAIGDIKSSSMTFIQAAKQAVQWFGKGSFVKVER